MESPMADAEEEAAVQVDPVTVTLDRDEVDHLISGIQDDLKWWEARKVGESTVWTEANAESAKHWAPYLRAIVAKLEAARAA
jgi:hypothetical protein